MPRPNRFRYRIYLTFLDLAELPALFDRFWLWSARAPALAWFRRADFLGDPAVPLDIAVRDRIESECGERPLGPIRLLTHIRHFGYNFNPVSFYYVYDASGSQLEFIVAEITNTPWEERHSYVLRLAAAQRSGPQVWRWQFDKQFHVSPFLPMDMRYDWRFSAPGESLDVHMTNLRGNEVVFDATLSLTRVPITSGSLARALLSVPFITLKVVTLIYWQALVLLLKRTPFYTHPDKTGVPGSAP